MTRAPVVVGGVGGSGTRLIAGLLRLAGFHIGTDLNEPLDNLTHVLFFTRRDILHVPGDTFNGLVNLFLRTVGGDAVNGGDAELCSSAVATCDVGDVSWRRARLSAISRRREMNGVRSAWKVPDTHIMLDRWRAAVPNLRYIHVVRHGLDMAFSANQQQLRRWGDAILGPAADDVTPRRSLKYWCAVQRRADERAREMGDTFLIVNYDRLCADPAAELPALLRFIDCTATQATVDAMRAAVVPPATIGRFRNHPISAFDAADVDYVESLGFAVR